jgi:hypothetical protein
MGAEKQKEKDGLPQAEEMMRSLQPARCRLDNES